MTSENAVALLDRTSAIIKRGWTQGVYARNENGDVVGPLDRTACKWCLRGALRRAAEDSPLEITSFTALKARMKADRALEAELNQQSFSSWNDEEGRTQGRHRASRAS